MAAGLTALLLLSACGSDGGDADAAPSQSPTPTPSASPTTPAPSPTVEATLGQPITACPSADEVAQSLGLAEVLPQSDYEEIKKEIAASGGSPASLSADPG